MKAATVVKRAKVIGDEMYGDDELIEAIEGKGVKKIGYWYETGSYDGSGFMVGQFADGMWFYHAMGHCSCYGPMDNIWSSVNAKFTKEDLLTIMEKEWYSDKSGMADLIKFVKKSK